jgi:hypothetical protein
MPFSFNVVFLSPKTPRQRRSECIYSKVRTFRETHKIWKNLPHSFDKSADLLSKRQNHEEDFFKLCVLLKKSELYKFSFRNAFTPLWSGNDSKMRASINIDPSGGPSMWKLELTKYGGSPFSAVFGSPGNRTIGKTTLIDTWFSTITAIYEFYTFKVPFCAHFHYWNLTRFFWLWTEFSETKFKCKSNGSYL